MKNLFIAMSLALGLINTLVLAEKVMPDIQALNKWTSELSLDVGDIQKTLAAQFNQQYIDHSDGEP